MTRNIKAMPDDAQSNARSDVRVSAIVSCYKGEKYLPAFLGNCAEQTMAAEAEIVLVHNQPSDEELRFVKDFKQQHPGLLNHIVVPREKLAISTNRAIKAASGEYVCVWNVDDLRTKNSLGLMAQTLDQCPEIGFTYGDYTIINQWQKTEGRYISPPEFEKREFIRGMHLGPFYMWRKNLCNSIGLWDEQCLQGADYEYAARLAVEYEGKKTQGLLGYYLDEGLGLSTKRATLQPIERTFIELRFGAYHKIDFWYLSRAKKYNINHVLTNDVWQDIDALAPQRRKFMESRFWLIYAVLRYPFWLVKRMINKIMRRWI